MSLPAAPDTPAPAPTPAPKPSGSPIGPGGDALTQGLGTSMSSSLPGLMKQREQVGQQEQKAIGELGTETAAQGVREAGIKGEAQNATADRAEQIKASLDEGLAKTPLPAYVPTQDTAQDLAGMFGLISVIGAVLGKGGGGQQSGLRAMDAMTGMLSGWQDGRQSLYDKNRADFEESLKEMQAKQKELLDAYNRNIEMLPYDTAKANTQMQIDLAKSASPLIQKQFQVQGWDALGKTIDGMTKAQGEIERMQLEQERVALERTRAANPGGRQSVYATLYTNNLATAANEISASIHNVTTAPAATSGFFQGRNTTGLLEAPLGVLTNKLTTQSTQMYNNELQSLGRNIAKIQAGGRQVPESTQKDFESQFSIKEGDKPGTVLEKLARARQATERAIQVQIVSPLATPEVKGLYAQILTQIQQDIPFTVDDVNAFVKAKDKQTTFDEFMQKQQAAGLGTSAPASAAQSGGETKYKVGQTITVNGKNYKVTGGDLNGDPDIEPVK